ncbi:MAG: nitroreductase family protein [Bacillus sp. (in: firmicutes)]
MIRAIADRTIQQTLQMYPNALKEALMQIAAYDAGAIAMQFMLQERGYDTVTMGGFDKDAFAKRFDLPENIFPITLIALGKSIAPAFDSSRMPIESLMTYYN